MLTIIKIMCCICTTLLNINNNNKIIYWDYFSQVYASPCVSLKILINEINYNNTMIKIKRILCERCYRPFIITSLDLKFHSYCIETY